MEAAIITELESAKTNQKQNLCLSYEQTATELGITALLIYGKSAQPCVILDYINNVYCVGSTHKQSERHPIVGCLKASERLAVYIFGVY